MLAEHGAKVVVNDFGGSRDGTGRDAGPAQEVVDEIVAAGGEAVANGADVSSFAEAEALIQQAIDTYGGLDVLVNNAGILRDRMIFSMTEEEWDAVIRVHLKGTFGPSHFAAVYWRERAKAGRDQRRPADQHDVGLGHLRQPGPDQLRRGQGRHRRLHADRLRRAGPLRGHRQRHRPRRPDPPDGGPRDHGRRAGGQGQPAVGRPHRDVAGVDGVGRRHRPGHRVLRQRPRRGRGLAPGPVDRPTCPPSRARWPQSSSR